MFIKFIFPTSKKHYIGVTQHLDFRLRRQHLIANTLVGRALRKYDDWVIEILHATKDRDVANLLEIEEIRHYNCVAPNGYNLTRGGEGTSGFHPSIETRKKMSESHIGVQPSKETRIKLSSWQIGRKCPWTVKRNKENKYGLGVKHPEMAKRNKENNPMKNPLNVKKMLVTRYRNKLRKLENG